MTTATKTKQHKVVEEMLNAINTPGKFSEKEKQIWNIPTDRRPGKEQAEELRHKYIHKFDWYTERNILGKAPRGIEQYGYTVEKKWFELVSIKEKETWERRFALHINSLYEQLDYSFRKSFGGYDFRGKRPQANQIRAEHLAVIESLKPESERRIAEREEALRKTKATSHNAELTTYLKNNFPYREATGKWAGGNTSISAATIKGEYKSEASGWSETVWSDNSKWKGLDAYYRFTINEKENCMVIGGLVTCYPKRYENKPVKPCTWWEQGRGFELNQKTGFLVGGYHSEAKTKQAAIRGAKASKRYYLKKDKQVLTPEFVHKKFGFCMAGIRNFMQQNNITTESLTVKELRETVTENRELNCRSYRNHLAKMGIELNCN